MKKIEFQVDINASAQKVWQVMWFHQTYKKWTTVFCEGSYYKGELKEGNQIHFLTPDGRGMYSSVESFKPNEYAAFKHIGDIKDFEEQPKENFDWSGALETYSLSEENGITTVKAINDAAPEFEDWFNNVFPKAMKVIKDMAEQPTNIIIETAVNAAIEKVWNCFTQPQHIMQWNNASPDWHTPNATNDLQVGGKFNYRMEAKDGSFGFDFNGTYTAIELHKKIEYTIEGGRKVSVDFSEDNNAVKIMETFEAEEENTYDLQEMGWQAILNNFKTYTQQINYE